MDDTEIITRGIKALYESLGSVDALKFLNLLDRGSNDYVEISHKLYSKQTVDEIFDRAKQSSEERS